MTCDNKNYCHDPELIVETRDGVRYVCRNCKEIKVFRIGKDGRMNNREYIEYFRKDSLQPSHNLYYKYHPELLSLA